MSEQLQQMQTLSASQHDLECERLRVRRITDGTRAAQVVRGVSGADETRGFCMKYNQRSEHQGTVADWTNPPQFTGHEEEWVQWYRKFDKLVEAVGHSSGWSNRTTSSSQRGKRRTWIRSWKRSNAERDEVGR